MPVNRNSVNKIIIVGHHESGLKLVESTLCRCGMKSALPSRREGFYPGDITALLRDEHRVPPSSSSVQPEDFHQIKPAPMWDSLVLDLALANSERALWGWSDSRAIVLIDYWLKSDPLASVVFVYDDPASLIGQGSADPAEAGEEAVRHQFENWAAYNLALLRVFSNHRERCVLASVRRMPAIPGACHGKLNLPLDPSKAAEGTAVTSLAKQTDDDEFDRLACAARQYVAACWLGENPEYARLYDDLQAAADLPDQGGVASQEDYKAIWESLAMTPRLLALGYCRMHASLLENQARQGLECGQQDDLFVQLQQSLGEVEECRLRIKRIAGEVALEERSAAEARIKKELRYRLGDALVSCSRSPGGWLRMPFALLGEIRRPPGREKGAVRNASNGGTDREKSSRKPDKEALVIKQQLSYRLGSQLVKHARSPIGWAILPFALVRETVAFKRKRRSADGPKTVKKPSHQDARKQTK
jgi:hypothetical protein